MATYTQQWKKDSEQMKENDLKKNLKAICRGPVKNSVKCCSDLFLVNMIRF
jgi:hypothetical protein